MQTRIKKIETEVMKKDIAEFRVGDTVTVHLSFPGEKKKKAQTFKGVVLKRRGGKMRESFTVRKISFGIGVERVFPLHSPLIEKIEVVKQGRVRRANLSYLRGKTKR